MTNKYLARVSGFTPLVKQSAETKEKPKAFNNKVLILGYGSVGQAILPLVLEHLTSGKNVTVIEKGENKKIFDKRNGGSGVTYIKLDVVEKNLEKTLKAHVSAGDFLIDVSLNIDAETIMEYCLKNGILYINTSLERWRTEPDETIPKLSDRTLYTEHIKIRNMAAKYPGAATSLATHGANPGLVTHLAKRALLELTKTKEAPVDREGWAQLMKKSGVKTIHIAERDSQVTDVPKEVNEFVNTWSCEGFWAEGRAPSELGWGTHEEKKPENGEVQGRSAYLDEPGMAVLMKSWVPTKGPYNGFCVQHSESITISQYFATEDGKYNPSVYYVYQPCDSAIASVHELRGRELDLQVKTRILKDDITGGIDELGVLLLGDGFGLWHGSQLSIQEARKLIPGESATSLQVVASMLGAILWAIKNPNRGYVEPEDIPFEEVLKVADRYLGPVPFVKTDWTPGKDTNSLFYRGYDDKNPCSFENYRVWT